MASLQARHSRRCALERPWTPADTSYGCTCSPTYYTVVREGKKLLREKSGKNRKDADRALTRVQHAEDEDAYEAPRVVKFKDWGPEWRERLKRPKANTRKGYKPAIDYAIEAFGERPVRKIGPTDIARFLRIMEEAEISPSTRSKHLRVLSACFRVAVKERVALTNPVDLLDDSLRPKVEVRERPWFEDDEIPRLLAEVPDGVFRVLFEVALKTGMRQGELVGLVWSNVNLLDAVIHVREQYTAGERSAPKSRTSRRDVHITSDVVELLGHWYGELGKPDDDTLVFPGDIDYLRHWVITRRELYPAMERAGIPREHARTGVNRDFHSLRHTFARIALENGKPIYWLSRHLGHSSTKVTEAHYGHLSTSAAKAEIAELEGAFGAIGTRLVRAAA
jgi:integrase